MRITLIWKNIFVNHYLSFLIVTTLSISCTPFGKSFFKKEHLIKSTKEISDINLVEDQIVSPIDFVVADVDSGRSCDSLLITNTDNTALIDSSSFIISGEAPYCFLSFKLIKDAFGESVIRIESTSADISTFVSSFRVIVARIFDDQIEDQLLVFEKSHEYTSNPTDGIEWSKSNISNFIKLKNIDLKDDSFATSTSDLNFSNYTSKDENISLDVSSNSLRLTASTLGVNYDSNFAEHSSSWSPKWDNIVHYWKMNEESGSSLARDSVGSASLTLSSSSIFNHLEGWLGKAASFNSSTLDVAVGFTPLSNFSISMWIYVRNLPTIANIWNTGNGGANGWGLRIAGVGCATPGTNLNILLGGITCDLLTGAPAVNLNQWMHIGISFDGSFWRLSTNGIRHYQWPTTVPNSSSATMRFGSGLDGMVDEAVIWNTTIDPYEFATIYNRQMAKFGGAFTSRVFDSKEVSNPVREISFSSSYPNSKEISYNGTELSVTQDSYGYLETLSNYVQNLVSYFRFASASAPIANGQTISAHIGPNATAMNTDASGFSYFPSLRNGTVRFDGIDDGLNLGTSINPTSNSFTVSFWQKSLPNGTSFWTFVSNRNSGAGNSGFWITQRTDGAPHVGKLRVQLNTTTLVNNFNVGTVNVSNGDWRHVVVVVDRSTNRMHFYVDGQVDVSDIDISAVGNISSTVAMHIGRDPSTANVFAGDIDEFAMWHRALSRQEVAELYRRGANRSFYQIRWCEKSDCSDNPSFVGIDGTVSSYLSEVVNTHNFTDTGIVNSTALSFVFSQLGSFFSGFQTWLSQASTKKYFQYRVFMDTLSDSSSTLCDTSNAHYGMSRFTSGSQPCMPDVKAIGFGPDRVYQDYVILNSNFEKDSAKDFGAYESFSVEHTSASCQAELGFQLRPVGTSSWYYYTGEKWTSALTNAQKNSASEVNQNISKFAEQVGLGRLDVRTIFKSGDGSKNCEIKQISISGKG